VTQEGLTALIPGCFLLQTCLPVGRYKTSKANALQVLLFSKDLKLLASGLTSVDPIMLTPANRKLRANALVLYSLPKP